MAQVTLGFKATKHVPVDGSKQYKEQEPPVLSTDGDGKKRVLPPASAASHPVFLRYTRELAMYGPTRSGPDAEHQRAVDVLNQFDCDGNFGPTSGLTRKERWQRARDLGRYPPPEVLVLLDRLGDRSV